MIYKTILLFMFAVGHLVVSVTAANRTWNGATTGAWDTASNWAEVAVPTNGDDVYITEPGACAILAGPSSNLNSITIGRTLVFTNWNTLLTAATVTIQTNGLITLPGAFSEAAGSSNRIWIACSNLTLDAGGLISADGRGYQSVCGPGKGTYGFNKGSGGGYGGNGGISYAVTTVGGTYGTNSAPLEPGSGGGSGWDGAGGAGGGAIRIEAADTVILNGMISANGTNSSCGGGSGGSIFITCTTLGGISGAIRAIGGAGAGTLPSKGGGGGGGRIALVYTNFTGAVGGLQVDASGGSDYLADRSDLRAAQIGTLFLSTTNPLADIWKNQVRGAFLHAPGFTSWIGSVTLSNANVGLPGGFTMTGGAVRIATTNCGIFLGASNVWACDSFDLPSYGYFRAGPDSRLACSGAMTLLTNAGFRMGSNSALICGGNILLDGGQLVMATNPALNCAGNMALTNGASLTVYAGATNGGSIAYGGHIGVTGDLVVGPSCWIYPYAEPANGGAVRFVTGSLSVGTNAGVNADGKGYPTVVGPGKGVYGFNKGSGAGHGGGGGQSYAQASVGATYDNTNAPILPGSGGGNGWDGAGTTGGGVVLFEVAGAVTMDGAFSANGASGTTSGAGAGGTVYVKCSSLSGGTTASIRADGGSASTNGATGGGGGGGGRVAIWIGVPPDKMAAYLAGQEVANIIAGSNYSGFRGMATVSNGAGWQALPDPRASQPGTCRFFKYANNGTLICIE